MGARLCTALNFRKADIAFLFTTTREIKKYHHRFFRKKTATDVITFADKGVVDIVISLDQALQQAKSRGLKLSEEVALLMCHGLLHAKGFDDQSEKDRLKMRQKEFESLARVL